METAIIVSLLLIITAMAVYIWRLKVAVKKERAVSEKHENRIMQLYALVADFQKQPHFQAPLYAVACLISDCLRGFAAPANTIFSLNHVMKYNRPLDGDDGYFFDETGE